MSVKANGFARNDGDERDDNVTPPGRSQNDFEGADRIPYDLSAPYGSDIAGVCMNPSPDGRPKSGLDEWGCLWVNIGASGLGEVKESPLNDWANWEKLRIPDIRDPKRWESI